MSKRNTKIMEGGNGSALAENDYREIYVEVARARSVSERMVNLQRQGRIGTFSQIDGQEVVTVGSMWALDPLNDWIVPAYRELRVLKRFPAERVLPVAVSLATQIPQAVGLAWGERLQERSSAVLVFFGDGASSEGDFYEGIEFGRSRQSTGHLHVRQQSVGDFNATSYPNRS